MGLQISEIRLDTFNFLRNVKAYTSEIQHPISEINSLGILRTILTMYQKSGRKLFFDRFFDEWLTSYINFPNQNDSFLVGCQQ